MGIRVYHVADAFFGERRTVEETKAALMSHEGIFMPVAIVRTDDLDEAYDLSQNTHGSWVKGDKVSARRSYDARSTSVGDVFVTSEGKRFVVASIGFTEF